MFRMLIQISTTISGISWRRWQYFQLQTEPQKHHDSDVVSKFHYHLRHLMARVAKFSTTYNPKKSCSEGSFKFPPPFQASHGAGGNIFNFIRPKKVMFLM